MLQPNETVEKPLTRKMFIKSPTTGLKIAKILLRIQKTRRFHQLPNVGQPESYRTTRHKPTFYLTDSYHRNEDRKGDNSNRMRM